MKSTEKISFTSAFNYKVIYAFTINDKNHKGLIKVGDATLHSNASIDSLPPNCRELNQAALNRIKEYTNTAGITPILLHTELAIKSVKSNDGEFHLKAFRDHDVHRVLENSGIKKVTIDNTTGREWFRINIATVIRAIEAVKHSYANLSNSHIDKFVPIIFRPEQEDAISRTVKWFKKSNRMLWNAKMRFGKTLSALEVAKQCKFEKTIIFTNRPAVNAGWYEDFTKIFHGTEYLYGSKKNGYSVEELLNKNKPFVYFASIQDLRGSEKVGGKYNKNYIVFKTVWDFVIVDDERVIIRTKLEKPSKIKGLALI